ncbi:hypothetical protein [Pseudomonas purpurea]|uniref:hypothetical protein n=1 Tax=Pseudomonas purpurea TaxID=3136737 RepID=UPI0032678E81
MTVRTRMLWLLLCTSPALAAEVSVQEARISLKNYGLVNCLTAPFKEESELRTDLGRASGAYHFMGKGAHDIVQNQDTLEIIHDPYQATERFMQEAYDQTPAASKHTKKKVVSYACLKVYNSPAFEQFIESQDPYLTK